MVKLGRIDFVGSTGVILTWWPRVIVLPASAASADNAFVAFPHAGPNELPTLATLVSESTKVAAILPALNFDPPEDHPSEAEFTWTDLLLNDFGDINDDIGTVAGVSGVHFRRLLKWQPRVDPERTALVAIVEPGPYERTSFLEPASLPILGEALVDSCYNAIAIRSKAGTDAEFHDVASYAENLGNVTGLPILHVSRLPRDIVGTSFTLAALEE
jgi:hypothetical protein